MTGGRRWPLHPQPGPLESLSSWLGRLAEPYEMPVVDLLRNLGHLDPAVPSDLDADPPTALLAALADRTGVHPDRLRAMTLAGHVPWLFDMLPVPPHHAQQVFDTYVRDNSVLFARSAAGHHVLGYRRRDWAGPWLLTRPTVPRVCPVCAEAPDRGTALVWRLALMTSCAEHGCRLQDVVHVRTSLLLGEPARVEPPDAARGALDQYTHQALTTGRVALPGREVHAGVWFRMLRSLLHEVSLAPGSQTADARGVLRQIWQATGHRERAGLNVWRPYEEMDDGMRDAMLDAAAAAVRLAADGAITARGRLGSALQAPPRGYVYGGDKPPPPHRRPQDFATAVQEALAWACADPGAARQLLGLLTNRCRTLDAFERERAYLCGHGVPAEFLPTARELGRLDLV